MDIVNKENNHLPVFEKTMMDSFKSSDTPMLRTPLQDVNNQLAVNKSTKKAYYSQITPTLKTPSRKAAKLRPSLLIYQDENRPDTDDILLNTLVYKKVQEAISSAKEQYENEIAEKEKVITDLREKIKTVESETQDQNVMENMKSCGIQVDQHIMGNRSSFGIQTGGDLVDIISCGTQADGNPCFRCEEMDEKKLNEQVSVYVDHIVSKCVKDLQSEQVEEFRSQSTEAEHDHQLQSAYSLINELQEELLKYTELTESLALAEKLQMQIQEDVVENYRKVKDAADRLTSLQQQTESKQSEMMSKMEANDMQMRYCREEKDRVLEKYDCMQKMLETSRESLAEMEAMYKTTCAELLITKSQMQVNSTELVKVTKAHEDSQTQQREAEARYKADTDRLIQDKDLLTARVTDLEETLTGMQLDLTSVKDELTTSQGCVEEQRETISSLSAQVEELGEINSSHVAENQDLQCKNEALIGSLHEKNEEIASLKCELRNMEDKLQSSEEKSSADMELLKHRCDSLLTEQALTRQAHIKQISEMEKEMERRDCSGQLKTAQGLIQELQTELSEYTELADSLKLAEVLQAKVQEVVNENYEKVKSAADKLLALKRNINKEKSEVIAQKKQNEEEKVDMDGMKVALDTSRSSMIQLEGLYNSTSADLLSATNQVQILSGELITVKKALEECQLSKSTLVKQIEDYDENEKAGFLEIQGLQASLKIQDDELQRIHKQMTEAEARHLNKVELLQNDKEQLTQAVDNLQRTLDSREEDLDHLEKELFEIREYMTGKLDNLDKLQTESDTTNMELKSCKAENMQLRDNCAVMQCTIQELKDTLQTNAYELSATQDHASRMLHRQGEELQQCSHHATDLTNKMDTLLQELQKKVGITRQQEEKPQKEGICLKKDTAKQCKARKSFLSEIFLAASQQNVLTPPMETSDASEDSNSADTSRTDNNLSGISPLQTSTENSPATVSRNKLGFSSSSAFAPVRTGHSLIVPQTGPLEVAKGDNSEILSTSDENNSTTQDTKDDIGEGTASVEVNSVSEECSNKDSEASVVRQIQTIDEYFMEIIRLANIIEKASRLSIEEVNADNEELRQNIQKLLFVEQELLRKEQEVAQQREVITTLEERLEGMSENLERFSDQESQIKSQISELVELKSQVRTLEGEKQVLSDQFKEAVNNMKVMDASQVAEGSTQASVTEVFSLKMKVQKLRDQLIKKEEYYEELGNKATRRLKLLEENWRRAESEVYRFDELMELVQQTLSKREDLIAENKDLKNLLKVIQGHKALPSEKESSSAPLKVIKTARW